MIPRLPHKFVAPGVNKIVDPREVMANFHQLMRVLGSLGFENFNRNGAGIPLYAFERQRSIVPMTFDLDTWNVPATKPTEYYLCTAPVDCAISSVNAFGTSTDDGTDAAFSADIVCNSYTLGQVKGATGKETAILMNAFSERRVGVGEDIWLENVTGNVLGITLELLMEHTS